MAPVQDEEPSHRPARARRMTGQGMDELFGKADVQSAPRCSTHHFPLGAPAEATHADVTAMEQPTQN